MRILRIGTRKSELALWQARWVQQRIQAAFPDIDVQLVTMDTKGDRNLQTPLPSVADKGFFTAEIEAALYAEEVDIAVHSLKDLPTEMPVDLEIGAYCEREEPRDVFLGKDGVSFSELPLGARVGTSSLRRTAQIKRLRPDITCVDVRGNLNTRWRKLQEGDTMDGIVLAAAGVYRLGWQDKVSEIFSSTSILSAPGQGIVAVENLTHREDLKEVLATLNHKPSEFAARTERSFLAALDGGCQTPLGAFATCVDGIIELQGAVFSLDGSEMVRVVGTGNTPEQVGLKAAYDALSHGASDILAAIRNK